MNLRLLMIIDSKTNENIHLKTLNKLKVKLRVISYGKGTASSNLLKHLGIEGEEEKMIILAILPKVLSKHVIKHSISKLNIHKPGG
jgi:hypothetical protein